MRRRRPELFPDSEIRRESVVQHDVLDHYLETLTRRKQEYEFEHFARLVAEQELCPNIRPQTGPTGGGDSKVDGETYPVGPEVSERWYAGDPAAGAERWAFAFSAKQQWQPKVRSDVKAIAATGRGYSRIIFITSQYAPDKKRATLEDTLSKEHSVPVTILDRTWLIEKVSRSDRSAKALEALGLSMPDRSVQSLGPNDVARLRDLEELDRKIDDPGRYRVARYSLAEDMLNAALAARGLGRDRTEVDGRFTRAAGIAEEVGSADQRLRIAYLHAWTTFWWFEDRAALDRMYDGVEALALASDHAGDVQKLVGLWQLLATPSEGLRPGGEGKPAEGRRERIVEALRRMAGDRARPNNAFQAEVGLAVMELPTALAEGVEEALNGIWSRLASVVERSAGQLNFSLETMFELVQAVGDLVPDSDAYDGLMDRFVSAIERRRSESAAGEANLRRALQKLSRGKPYDAIRMLGKAELDLAKDERRALFVTTLVALASAYQEAGLPWAARTKVMLATEQCFVLLRERGDIEPSLIRTLQRLVWAEIQLGRLPQCLVAWSYVRTMAALVEVDGETRAGLHADFALQDAAVATLILKADIEQLRGIEHLPEALGELDLPLSRAATFWALGHEALEHAKPDAGDEPQDPETFFTRLLGQPLAAELPASPDLGVGGPVGMTTVVLGLEVTLTCERTPSSIYVGEAVLSALEAFFSTSLDRQVVPWREELRIEIASSGEDAAFATEWSETDEELVARLDHPGRTDFGREGERERFSDWLRDLIGEVIGRTLIVPDAEQWIRSVAGDERGFSRAISLGNVPILAESLYGASPKLSIGDWAPPSFPRYELRRTAPWRAAGEPPTPRSDRERGREGERPDYRPDRARHSDRRISSIINMPLWNRANWVGTGSMVAGPGDPLMLGLAFRNQQEGARIFEQWRIRFGMVDADEAIRVTIILGISRRHPANYAVTVGRALEGDERLSSGRHFVSFTRIQRMEPASRENLDRFLDAFRREGAYLLTAMPMKARLRPEDFRSDLAILKRQLVVRQAWEIGPHDPEAVVIRPDDDPILPGDGRTVPVLETIARARTRPTGSFE